MEIQLSLLLYKKLSYNFKYTNVVTSFKMIYLIANVLVIEKNLIFIKFLVFETFT